MRGRLSILFVGFIFLFAACPGESRACPNCKEAVAAQPSEVEGMARGYNMSVMFMLAVPFSVLSAGSWAVARAVKRGVLPEL
jgi:hypothetical protein